MMRLLTPYWQNQHFAADIFNELDRRPTAERFAAPAYEVQENEQHYLIETDLPGVKKEDIKIDLHENILTITGERKRDAKAESFKRSFTLPESVDVEKIEASHENGVLSIYLPKGAAAKPRTIEIQTKSGGFFDKLSNPSH